MNSLDISLKALWKVVAVAGIIAFIWVVRDILAILFFAVIISSAITPLVNRLHNLGVPRALGAFLVYVGFFGLAATILSFIVPPLGRELAGLVAKLRDNPLLFGGTQTLEQFVSGVEGMLTQFLSSLSKDGGTLLTGLAGIAGGVSSVIFTLVMSFYLTLEDEGIKGLVQNVVPQAHQQKILNLIDRTQKTLGRWVKGQLLLGLIVGLMVFAGLFLLGNKFAISLGILAGVLELVPYLGPLVAAVPGVLIAFSFSQDVFLTLLTLGVYVVVQQLENHIIVPLVMRRAIDLDPLLILFALLVGGKIGGFAGVILAVPTIALIAEYVRSSTGVDLKLKSHRKRTSKQQTPISK